jgi:hypothetical protein
VSLEGDTLKIHRGSGETVSVQVKSAAAVSAVKTIKLSEIKPGSFVGTAATTGADEMLSSKARAGAILSSRTKAAATP